MSYEPCSEMFAKVILASEHPNGTPLYSVHMRYPRPIHGEVMTHREFSRNARSSRAVPVKTMLEEVWTKPYIPWHWLKNQKGMQGTVPLTEGEIEEAVAIWLEARDEAVFAVERLFNPDGLNIHKQNPNRLLEPFSWIDTLVTTTSFSNFLWLREHTDAEPHLQDLAHMVAEAIQAAPRTRLAPGMWHLPYITDDERRDAYHGPSQTPEDGLLRMLSAARCARISYTPFDGDPSVQREIERYNQLVTSERVHASPLEHQATPDTLWEKAPGWKHPELHGNLPGWVQARKLVPGEYHA